MICVSFNSNIRVEELKKLINRKVLIELRTDLLGIGDIKTILEAYNRAILTIKNIDFESIKELLKYEPKGIDIDVDMPKFEEVFEYIQKNAPKTKIIVSYHNFKKTPKKDKLDKIIEKMRRKKPQFIKIATYIKKDEDNVRLLNLLERYNDLIVVGMGKNGRFSRLVSFLLGSKITYLALSYRTQTAPNQYTIKEFMEYINYDFWNIDWL